MGKLLLALVLLGCQPRVWQATPGLVQTEVPVDKSIPADAATEAIIAPYRAQYNANMTEVLGTAPEELTKGDYQSPLANFVVDLLLYQGRQLYGQPLDLAVTNKGGLRAPLPKGPVRLEHVYEVVPFENELVVLTLDGATVQELFDFAAASKIAHFANATYTVQNGKATDIKIGGKPFNPNRTYNVLTSDFLQHGGDNMTMLGKAQASAKVGMLLRDAIIKHIREQTAAGRPITADTRSRVTVLPSPAP